MNSKSSAAEPKTDRRFARWLFIIISVSLVARLVAAPFLPEFRYDTLLFQLWGYQAVENGLTNVYEGPLSYPAEVADIKDQYRLQSDVNYLPPYLMVVYVLEIIRRFFNWPLTSVFAAVLTKLPAILADIATIWLIARIVKQRTNNYRLALFSSAIYAAHPAIFYLSAGFGQVDSIPTFFSILAIWRLTQKKWLQSSIWLTVSYFFKMQAVAFVPLFIFVLLNERSYKLILKTAGTVLLTATALTLPFIMAGKILPILNVIFSAPGRFPILSSYAFNLWWLLSGGLGNFIGDQVFIFGFPLAILSLALYFIIIVATLARVGSWYHPDSIWLAAACCSLAFFLFPTEMHERYLFPIFAILAIVISSQTSLRLIYATLTITFTLNILYLVTIIFRPWPNSANLLLYLSLWPAIINVVVYPILASILWSLSRRPDPPSAHNNQYELSPT